MWTLTETTFDPQKQHHHETIFTIGNGYLCTRGSFEEGYPADRRATFVHGVFDAVPVVFTELANAPDWLPLTVWLDGERFSLHSGQVEAYQRSLDLRTGVLTRSVRWVSPGGKAATINFERFASLADEHALLMRCSVTPEFSGTVEVRAALNGNTDNEGVAHWRHVAQGCVPSVPGVAVYLLNRTRQSGLDLACAMRLVSAGGKCKSTSFWDVENTPTLAMSFAARPGETIVVNKFVAVATSRETTDPVETALNHVQAIGDWPTDLAAHSLAWEAEWQRSDVTIEGDDEAQLAVRFSLYQLLIAAPRRPDADVNIGAKTLSGFGYRGHAFWDTEIFMLPVFTYTAPHIAKNLLDYRYKRLPAARGKAQDAGYEGAWFAWESAETGEEVTPTWLPDSRDRKKLARVWTGDLSIHISADVAYGVHQFWRMTGDDAWMVERGAEIILDTAKFWASRAEWNTEQHSYGYSDVIGPDENHDHVDNNAYTNHLARWNLLTGLDVLSWLQQQAPIQAKRLCQQLDLTPERLAHWQDVIEKLTLHQAPNGLIEQFDGFFALKDANLADYEPRTRSMQEIFGIEGANEYQALKQPDVLMVQYLLHDQFDDSAMRINYDYYTPRTDHTYGSSLGPSIQAIVACRMGDVEDAYEHFIRSARADLRDVRGNAGDGIHAASAGGTWQAVVFGFAGLQVGTDGWTVTPHLPHHWRRVTFKFVYRGQWQEVSVENKQ
jgi:kojibiose phosphorylase